MTDQMREVNLIGPAKCRECGKETTRNLPYCLKEAPVEGWDESKPQGTNIHRERPEEGELAEAYIECDRVWKRAKYASAGREFSAWVANGIAEGFDYVTCWQNPGWRKIQE